MLIADQIETMFPDLADPDVESALALVHQRFSTNTFPSWPLAHPYRYVAHNGEINTLRGNINWMHAREAMCESDLLGDDLQKILPVIREGGSDTATFDNVLEFLVMTGRSLPHAVLMMIPEPWAGHESMSAERKAFYEYHATMMEPWDGPASIAFTDGKVIGAVLDRNGLRPSRYYVTKDDLVVMASEVGVLEHPRREHPAERAAAPGPHLPHRHRAGAHHRRRGDQARASRRASPYGEWLDENMVALEDLKPAPLLPLPDHYTMLNRQRTFGYTQEDLKILLAPMALNGEEAIGSMGTDTALAVLSDKPRLLYDYFTQLFAQVTNPPLDAIREELVTSMGSTIGPEANLLKPGPEACRQIKVKSAIVNNDELARLRHIDERGFKSITLPMLFDAESGGAGLARALEDLQRRTSEAVEEGYTIIILSDRGVNMKLAPIPSLLATAGVHHHLVREGTRNRAALVIETGEAREVHHLALLIGYGAGAVNPYLAFETLDDMIRSGMLPGPDAREGRQELHQGAEQGRAEGDVQDGHLDAAELSRRADFRSRRPREGLRRSLFHAYRVAHRRRRHRRDRRRSARAPRAGVPRAAGCRSRSRRGRRVPVAARRGVPPLQPRHGVQAAARDAHRSVSRSTRNTRRR